MSVSKIMLVSLIALIVALFIIGMFQTAKEQPTYSLRPLITVENWVDGEFKIRFPYHEEKYIINYESPFDYTTTENGYDLTIHFVRKEK